MAAQPFRFVVLWFDRNDNAYQLLELEEALEARQLIPRAGDYMTTGVDEDAIRAQDEKGNAVTLNLKVVAVDSVMIDPFTDEVTITCVEMQDGIFGTGNQG